jgi:putative ABC transport system permease protein
VLVVAEIFCSFLVLFGVTTLAVFSLDNYRQPLGFQGDDVWVVTLNAPQAGPGGQGAANAGIARRLLASTREFPEVDGSKWKPMVVTADLARTLFGDEDPIGRVVPEEPPPHGEPPRPELRVIGVIGAFRQHGEFAEPVGYAFRRFDPQDPEEGSPRLLVLKVRPGTPAAFEETVMARLQREAPDWSFELEPLAQMRESFLKDRLTPMIVIGTVAAFLMLMVALGLTGVVWQNVTQRTREIGLRRAKGATAGRIHRQILGELMVMTTLALAAGLVVVVQFPLLDLVGAVRPAVYAASLAISALAIYGLALVFGWYPSRLATTVQPAEALRYE